MAHCTSGAIRGSVSCSRTLSTGNRTSNLLITNRLLYLLYHCRPPTHTKGHTLDLVITGSAPISNLQVYDIGVSDHKVVSMALTFVLPTIRPKRQMSFRNWKSIDSATMTMDLQLITCPASASVDELVELYNTSLSSVFDLHAPVKTREVNFSRSAPWFTHELRKIKTAGRVLERRYRHSGLTVHKLAFREHQRAYSNSLKDACSQFYSSLIIIKTLATLNSFLPP